MAPSKTIDQATGRPTPPPPAPGGRPIPTLAARITARPARPQPEPGDEAGFFLGCGIGKPHVERAARAARAHGTTLEQELIAAGLIAPHLYYRWMAGQLGLDYLETIDPAEVVRVPGMDVLLRRKGPLRLTRPGRQVTAIAPEARQFEAHRARLAAHPGLRKALVAAPPAAIREAVWQAGASNRVRRTTFDLDQDRRDASARRVMTSSQGFALATTLSAAIAAFALWPFTALCVLHVVLTLFFSSGVLLRLWALAASLGLRRGPPPAAIADGVQLPVYTLLIALRQEAAMAPALVRRIAALDWPKSLLDVKYVCEAEDEATISALQAQNLGPECEIVRVPRFGPRTKPKALQYALSGARGELVAVYDAEDKPAPGQLREAFAAFARGGPRLGCLQAPLAVANVHVNWLTGLFALEYSGLFRVLVPFLARARMPIPLGGTSNHFRRAVLDHVGGWDPHNVTEDADLGMRLYAHGYRTGALRSATVEMAPVTHGVWLRQRTRWLKGWVQTWLVAMRHPARTFRALGPRGFLVFQVMIAGMLVSALMHPAMFVFVALTFAWLSTSAGPTLPLLSKVLMWADFAAIGGSYLAFLALGWTSFTRLERGQLKKRWMLLTPAYWLMMSFAGWRALHQLSTDAHLWEKTPHHPDG